MEKVVLKKYLNHREKDRNICSQYSIKIVLTFSILLISVSGFSQTTLPAQGALVKDPWGQKISETAKKELEKLQIEKEAHEKFLKKLEAETEAAQKTYEAKKLEYEKIKKVSRDWVRRDKAEADFLKSSEAHQALKQKLDAEKLILAKLDAKIEIAQEKVELQKFRAQASEKKIRKKIFTLVYKVLITFGIILLFLLLSALGKSIVNRHIQSMYKKYYARKVISYTVAILAFIVVVNLVMFNMVSLLGTFAILLPTVLVLMDVFQSFVGWFIIIGPRGYKPGDRIQVDDILGDVIDIGLLRTALLEVKKEGQSTGKIVFIPNNHVLKKPFFNYSAGSQYIWNEISFLLTFESNWQKARKIILDHVSGDSVELLKRAEVTVNKLTNRFMFIKGIMTPTVYTKIKPEGIELTLRYLTTVRDRRNSEDQYYTFAFEKFKAEKDIFFVHLSQIAA